MDETVLESGTLEQWVGPQATRQAFGMAAGEIIERGSILFLGRDLRRAALVAAGKDMAIVYGAGEVSRGPLVFWLSLHYAGNPLIDPGLSATSEALADAIIRSIILI